MPRHVHVLYCDDVRNEVGGKQSLMGIYRGNLLVAQLPAVLPKLCVIIDIESPTDAPLHSLVLRILKDDDVLLETSVPEAQLAAGQSHLGRVPSARRPDDQHLFNAIVPVQFAPFVVDKPSALRVRVIMDGEEFRGNGLNIDIQPTAPGSASEAVTAAAEEAVRKQATSQTGRRRASRKKPATK